MTELEHVTIERKEGMERGARDRITKEFLDPGHPELREAETEQRTWKTPRAPHVLEMFHSCKWKWEVFFKI